MTFLFHEAHIKVKTEKEFIEIALEYNKKNKVSIENFVPLTTII